MSLTRFREYTSEILLNTYLLLQRAFAEKGEQVIYSLLSQTIQSSAQTNAAGALEVCLFAARSIFDGFEDSEWNNSTLTFVKQNFQFIHSIQHQIQNASHFKANHIHMHIIQNYVDL